MTERYVTVEWVGGPFDEYRFKLPEGKPSIHVRYLEKEFDLPVVRRGRGFYVVWDYLKSGSSE